MEVCRPFLNESSCLNGPLHFHVRWCLRRSRHLQIMRALRSQLHLFRDQKEMPKVFLNFPLTSRLFLEPNGAAPLPRAKSDSEIRGADREELSTFAAAFQVALAAGIWGLGPTRSHGSTGVQKSIDNFWGVQKSIERCAQMTLEAANLRESLKDKNFGLQSFAWVPSFCYWCSVDSTPT